MFDKYKISVRSTIFYLWWREMERQAWSMEVPVNLALMIRWGLNKSNVTFLVDRWHETKKTTIKMEEDTAYHKCFVFHWYEYVMAREGSHWLPLPLLPELAPRHLPSEHLHHSSSLLAKYAPENKEKDKLENSIREELWLDFPLTLCNEKARIIQMIFHSLLGTHWCHYWFPSSLPS